MTQLTYFCIQSIQSNLPFAQFENLLGTSSTYGLQLGDINHTGEFLINFLHLVDFKLIKKTYDWVYKHEHLTVTLDVGTEYGIQLLAVSFISGGKSKLVDIMPLIKKKGIDFADLCFHASNLSNNLKKEVLVQKIVGITGDGAFTKGNAPFKKQNV